jgi:NitT/TauT family transport system substrate-binding protein
MRLVKTPAVLVAAALSVLASACTGASGSAPAATLRLGYFPNVTHAGAVYGVASGIYARELGSTKLKSQTFNAGPAEVEALFAGAIDAAYIGPGPALNAFIKSRGAVAIVAGATSGGAQLVVRPGVTDLRGKTIADPQTGGTQDIALRTYLASQGLKVDRQGGGDARIVAQENAQTLDLFKAGDMDGAWVPEPWASRLVLEGGGKVLVDERSLWPGGQFVTTVLLVRRAFLDEHPETVTALLKAQVAADKEIVADPAKAQTVVNGALKVLTGKSLKPAVIARAFQGISVTEDPLAPTLKLIAEHAFATGLVKKGSLHGIYDLTLLRQVLGRPVDDAGLGKG